MPSGRLSHDFYDSPTKKVHFDLLALSQCYNFFDKVPQFRSTVDYRLADTWVDYEESFASLRDRKIGSGKENVLKMTPLYI